MNNHDYRKLFYDILYFFLHFELCLGNCLCLDDTRHYADDYNHQPIDAGNAHEKDYFHFSAPDFTEDLTIGFSNGYTGHGDEKWEVIVGGGKGDSFSIRPGNAGRAQVAMKMPFPNREQYEEVRKNFAVRMTDGNIALYSADSDGSIKDLIVEWNDDTIIKSYYNTLTVTGGWGGSGTARVRGVCRN